MAGKLLAEWFWTDRWTGSSAFLLPIDARGLYREMLTQAWQRHARLPNDPEAIRRATGVTDKEWRRAWPLIQRYWRVDGDSLVNDTQLEVYAEAQGIANRASERGSKGGRARAQALAQAKAQDGTQAELEVKPLTLTPSQTTKEIGRVNGNGNGYAAPSMPDEVLRRRAGSFLEDYPEIYAKCRNGATYRVSRLKMDRDLEYAYELVQGWDDARLRSMLEVFLLRDDHKANNQPGTPGQFLNMAPDCDSLMRRAGK